MPVCLCLCTFIEIRNGTKNLDFVLCTVVYIGLGKTSVTIWTIGSLENWGNHWVKWTILRSFRATWVTLPDCIGGVTWQHIGLHCVDVRWVCSVHVSDLQWSIRGFKKKLWHSVRSNLHTSLTVLVKILSKKAPKTLKMMDNFSDILSLEGAGPRPNDTRLTIRFLLTNLGYNGSN